MKNIDLNSKIILRAVIRRLIESMELLNKISEQDYRKIVLAVQKNKECLKGVQDNAGTSGNLFMMLFF